MMFCKSHKIPIVVIIVAISVFVVCFACKTSVSAIYDLTYIADSGGVVYGNLYQTIKDGDSGTQDVVIANDGYETAGALYQDDCIYLIYDA